MAHRLASLEAHVQHVGHLRVRASMPRSGSHGDLCPSTISVSPTHASSRLVQRTRSSMADTTISAIAAGVEHLSQPSSPFAAGHESPSLDPAIVGLAEYIKAAPLLSVCNIQPSDVDQNLAEWHKLGKQLAKQLGFDHERMDDAQRLRIYHYYLPVYFWCKGQLDAHQASGSTQPLVIGISAPQGCGKSTLVEQLQELFTSADKPCASVSIDDFYLTYQDQTALAQSNPNNPLHQYRGNAGSHDLKLGTDTLKALKELTSPGATAAIPRYDKSAYSGRGDRADPSTWPEVQGPLQIILFEGWMSGFRPLPDDEQAETISPGLGAVNAHLRGYEAAWDALVDSWLVIKIGDPQWVYRWRQQAEEKMRASGKPGMTDAQIVDFVNRYQPAYKAYLPLLYEKGPTTVRPGHTLILEVDQNRSPVPNQPEPVL